MSHGQRKKRRGSRSSYCVRRNVDSARLLNTEGFAGGNQKLSSRAHPGRVSDLGTLARCHRGHQGQNTGEKESSQRVRTEEEDRFLLSPHRNRRKPPRICLRPGTPKRERRFHPSSRLGLALFFDSDGRTHVFSSIFRSLLPFIPLFLCVRVTALSTRSVLLLSTEGLSRSSLDSPSTERDVVGKRRDTPDSSG